MSKPYRLQVSMPYRSHLPRDVAENVFHLLATDGVSSGVVADNAQTVFASMFNSGVTGMTHPLGYYMSPIIDRALCRLDLYDPALPVESPPVQTRGFSMAAAGTIVPLPEEIALCTSWVASGLTADGSPELILRRRRGRTYWGPLCNSVIGGADGDGASRPTALFVTDLKFASAFFIQGDIPGGGGSGFAIYSKTALQYTIVTNGWIDNEWDTQRRRGATSNSRTLFDTGTFIP